MCFRPCYDHDYETAAREWITEFEQWQRGEHPDQKGAHSKYYWEWAGTPDEDTCRPAFTSEPTCYQIYETVSEGTPVSPVFETLAAMEAWLVAEGVSRDAARNFCQEGWVPSMVLERSSAGVKIFENYEAAGYPPKGE